MNAELYFREMLQHFPELEDEISGIDKDNIHYNMERFAEYTILQIKESHAEQVKHCFMFQEKNIPLMNAPLINALTTSYCEILLKEAPDQTEAFIPLMGPHLRSIYSDYKNYLARMNRSE